MQHSRYPTNARRGRSQGTPRLAAAVAGIVLAIAPIAPGGAIAETVTPVFQHALPDNAGKTVTMVKVTFAPASRAAPHRHGQAFLYAFVLTGTVSSQIYGQPSRTYDNGEGWFEPPGSHHVLTENPSPTEPAELSVVFVAETGAALKIDDAQEGPK